MAWASPSSAPASSPTSLRAGLSSDRQLEQDHRLSPVGGQVAARFPESEAPEERHRVLQLGAHLGPDAGHAGPLGAPDRVLDQRLAKTAAPQIRVDGETIEMAGAGRKA